MNTPFDPVVAVPITTLFMVKVTSEPAVALPVSVSTDVMLSVDDDPVSLNKRNDVTGIGQCPPVIGLPALDSST